MNPLLKQSQSSKEDSSTMDEQEKKLKEKYGKLPMKKNMLSGMKERKYFDSGDYAMQKAGVAAPDSVGSVGAGQGLRGMEGLERATPERLPHAQPPSLSSSPTNSTILSPPAMPASPGPASPPPTGSAPRGLPIPGGNASQINHSSNATIPIARGSSHSPSSSSSIPAAVNTSGGHSPGSRPNVGSPSPSGGLSPSTSFGAGVAAGQGHSFSAKREGSGGAGPAATSKVGLPGNAGVGVETNRISPPVASHSPLMTSGSVPPSSFPINHHLAGSQSNNPASPSNLRDQNPLLEGAERRSSLSANSPVKPSNLSLGLRRQEENAMED